MKITFVPSIRFSLPSVDELPPSAHVSPSEIQHISNGQHGEDATRRILSLVRVLVSLGVANLY